MQNAFNQRTAAKTKLENKKLAWRKKRAEEECCDLNDVDMDEYDPDITDEESSVSESDWNQYKNLDQNQLENLLQDSLK